MDERLQWTELRELRERVRETDRTLAQLREQLAHERRRADLAEQSARRAWALAFADRRES